MILSMGKGINIFPGSIKTSIHTNKSEWFDHECAYAAFPATYNTHSAWTFSPHGQCYPNAHFPKPRVDFRYGSAGQIFSSTIHQNVTLISDKWSLAFLSSALKFSVETRLGVRVILGQLPLFQHGLLQQLRGPVGKVENLPAMTVFQ